MEKTEEFKSFAKQKLKDKADLARIRKDAAEKTEKWEAEELKRNPDNPRKLFKVSSNPDGGEPGEGVATLPDGSDGGVFI